MQLLPAPNYIIVRINKINQRNKKEKAGILHIVTDSKNEARNMQCGEVAGVGANVPDIFPQLKIGQTAILHWFVESMQKDNKIFEDETYNYYAATVSEHNGKANETYGVWDGENIIPNPAYIFLEKPYIPKRGFSPEEFIEAATKKTDSGLFLFEEWDETRTDKEQKMAKINTEIQSLTKTKMSADLKNGIAVKEAELASLSNEINKQCIEFYKVAAINPDMNEEIESSFGRKIEIGEKVAALNAACKTTVEFNNAEYIVALSKHIHCPEYWCLESVKNFKLREAS